MRKVLIVTLCTGFLVLAGFGVRYAEDSQVGYTNDTSTWIFAAAGLLVYAAVMTAYFKRRNRRHATERTNAK